MFIVYRRVQGAILGQSTANCFIAFGQLLKGCYGRGVGERGWGRGDRGEGRGGRGKGVGEKQQNNESSCQQVFS